MTASEHILCLTHSFTAERVLIYIYGVSLPSGACIFYDSLPFNAESVIIRIMTVNLFMCKCTKIYCFIAAAEPSAGLEEGTSSSESDDNLSSVSKLSAARRQVAEQLSAATVPEIARNTGETASGSSSRPSVQRTAATSKSRKRRADGGQLAVPARRSGEGQRRRERLSSSSSSEAPTR